MTELPTKKSMLESSYTFSGLEINDKYNKSKEWSKKNALRELNQKRIKNDRQIVNKKNECLVTKGLWKCPHCHKEVPRLTCAHVGMPVAKILDEILEQNPDENDIIILDKIVQQRHATIQIVICCDKCNHLLDDTK